MSDEEIASQTAACESWRTRRAAQAARREAAANMVIVSPDGDEDGPQGMDMDQGDGGATLTQAVPGTLPMPQFSQAAQEDNFIGDDEMAAIAAAEEAAAAASVAKKRDRPQTPAVTASSGALKEEPMQEAAHAAAKKRPKVAGDAASAKSPPPPSGTTKKVAKRPAQKVQ